jgi:hypothetical protein
VDSFESQVLICAGVPGMPNLVVGDGSPYPATAIDLAKLLRERGLAVSFADEADQRKYVQHNAADVWVPILEVARDLLIGISGGLFTQLIVDWLGSDEAKKSVLHVEYRITDSDGNVKQFKAEGPGNEVLEAIDSFERQALEMPQRSVLDTKQAGNSSSTRFVYDISKGLERLREGEQAARSVAYRCESGLADEEDHQLLRKAIKALRSAMNWLEGSEYFERAHTALDEAGRFAREYFPEGCTLVYRNSVYFVECPVPLAHNRLGMSSGEIYKSIECSICGDHPQDCAHIKGRIYDDERCVWIIKDVDILEFSFVGRPRHPDARIESMSVGDADLQASLGSEFKPGVPVTCDRCLTVCDGVIFPFKTSLFTHHHG